MFLALKKVAMVHKILIKTSNKMFQKMNDTVRTAEVKIAQKQQNFSQHSILSHYQPTSAQ